MDPNKEIESLEQIEEEQIEDSTSVDDFLKELEAKEKDLHITSETTFLEIAEEFEDEDEIPDFIRSELAATNGKVSQESAAADTKPQQDVAELEERIAELSERLENFAAEKAEMIKTSNRRAKDFQNYKTRTEREKNELFANQLCNIATEMLPALDNLDRAVVFARGLPDDQPTDFRQFVDGVILVNQQVNDVLADLGIEAIPTIGHLFDPHYHEAVATEESEEFPPNTICGELLRGYRIGERVVRHSLVKVAAGGAEPDEQPGADDENAPAERDEADPAYDPDANDIDRNDDPDNEVDEHDELS